VGDFNRDGKVDFYVTAFSDDYNTLYTNDGDGNFTDKTFSAGLADPTIPFLGWGTVALDFDNDGLTDLFVANGHVYPAVDQQDWAQPGCSGRSFFEISMERDLRKSTGYRSGLAELLAGRGAAVGDLFNDGHLMLSSTTWTPVPRCCETW